MAPICSVLLANLQICSCKFISEVNVKTLSSCSPIFDVQYETSLLIASSSRNDEGFFCNVANHQVEVFSYSVIT